MDLYREFLKHTIDVTAKASIIYISACLVAAIIFYLLKKKFNTETVSKWLLIIAAVIFIGTGIQIVPRVIDLKQNSFATVEDGVLLPIDDYSDKKYGIDAFTFGTAEAFGKYGSRVTVCGTKFFDKLSSDKKWEFRGNIVYAEHSGQLIAVKKGSVNLIENK